MRRTTTPSRWATPRRLYAGNWSQNPWINAVFIASQARCDADGDGQQAPAVITWENEGGRLAPAESVRR